MRPHGTTTRYTAGCRCVECRAAKATYERERYARRRRGEPRHSSYCSNHPDSRCAMCVALMAKAEEWDPTQIAVGRLIGVVPAAGDAGPLPIIGIER